MSVFYPDMREWLTEPTVRLLNRFTNCANKETWSANPADRERWTAFITAAHQENTELPETVLRDWLTRESAWPKDKASELAKEYETKRARLAAE